MERIRYNLHNALRNIYYPMGFVVLLVSELLLIFLGIDCRQLNPLKG